MPQIIVEDLVKTFHVAESGQSVDTWFGCVAPMAGILFLLLSLQVWRVGVRHYRSTGS